MRASIRLLACLMLRPMRQEPVRTALTVLAVALGVGVVVAIDLAGTAAAGSFQSSMESLAGKGDLEVTAVGGVDEALLGKLAAQPYAWHYQARIEDFATVEKTGEAVPLIGIDLVANAALATDQAESEAGVFATQNPIWVGRRLGYRVGEQVELLVNDRRLAYTVRGVLPHREDSLGEENAIVMDIGLAQEATGKVGRVDRIELRLPTAPTLETWTERVRALVPAGVEVRPQGTKTNENRKMLGAFRWNLRVLSYVALVVGAFLIYNTIAVSVVRRRAEVGIVRALGGTRGQILSAFLAEAAFFGVIGGAAGVWLGRVLAVGAVQLLGSTVEALYVSSRPAPIALSWLAGLTGLAIGVGTALAAALGPAWEAARVAPTEAMARGRRDYQARQSAGRSLAIGVVLLVAAGLMAQLPPVDRQPLFGYLAAVLLIVGMALIIPWVVAAVTTGCGGLARRVFGVQALLAMRSLRASLGRTAVLVAALATAVAMMASVGIMVGSFRETVLLWMDNQLQADLYLRPGGSAAADRHPTVGADLADRIERLPGVGAVDRFRVYSISYQGLPASLAGGETAKIPDFSKTGFLPGQDRHAILDKLPRGDYVIVSEPFANKHHVRAGETIQLPLAGHVRPFQVLGVYYDYSTERGFITMDRRVLLKYLPDPASSGLAVFLRPEADGEAVRRAVDRAIAGRGVLVFTNSRLRTEAIRIFDRTFAITYALELVAVVVAVMGIAGALLALVIDRRREFGLLRFLGASTQQVRGMVLCEAGLLGLVANGVGLVLGTALSLVLIYVINKQSFGWTIQFHWPVVLLLGALTGIYAATVLAGLYPARTATQLNPIEVVHEE